MSLNTLKRFFTASAVSIAAITGFTSCDSVIYDDLEECRQGVELRFVYDYNMEFANAFPSQVDCLTVFFYDEEGNYITTRTENSEVLHDENYRMVMDLEPGKYHVIAYGGMYCDSSSFEWTSDPESTPMENLQTRLKPSCLTSPVGTNLHPLFYGVLELDVEKDLFAYQPATVYMMKDTNNLRIVLQQNNGEPVNNQLFDFSITDDNTLMAWNNDVIPTQPVTYEPWARGNVVAGTWDDTDQAVQVGFAEISFPRLVTSNQPMLTITRRDNGNTIIHIPLIKYLLLLKSENYKNMPAQEFLDRESRWSMIFFLDRNMVWLETRIVINGWVVRLNDTEFV